MTRDSCISNVCSGRGRGGTGNHFVNMDFLGLSTHCVPPPPPPPLTTHAAAAGSIFSSGQPAKGGGSGIFHIQHFYSLNKVSTWLGSPESSGALHHSVSSGRGNIPFQQENGGVGGLIAR